MIARAPSVDVPLPTDVVPETTATLRPWAVALLITTVIGAAYVNSFPGAFFFDDDAAILQNASLRNLLDLRHVFWPPVAAGIGGRPFANLVMALNYAVTHYSAAGFHAVNLAVHIGAALLLFGVARRTLLAPVLRDRFGSAATGIAAMIALVWGLHPLQANIADYVSQRTEGMMAILYLLTLYGFVRGATEASAGWTMVAIVSCALGVFTKEDIVTAPAMVWLYDRTFISGTFVGALKRNAGAYVGLALSWALLAVLMSVSHLSARGIGFGLGPKWYDYAVVECTVVVRYLKLALWPHPLIFDYGPDLFPYGPLGQEIATALPSIGILLIVLGVTVVALRRAPVVGFTLAWFFVVLSPSSSVIPVAEQPCAENRPYLPLVGIAALLVGLAYRALGRRGLIAAGAVAFALGLATAIRNPVFSSEVAVWWDTVAKNPDNARAENNLGNALLKIGHTEEALPYFEAAIRLSPRYADARNNRGVTLLRLGHPADAVGDLLAATKDKADYADAFYNLGEAYLQLHRTADALPALEKARQLDPDNPKVRNNLGIALLDSGRVPESIAEERRALELNPAMPEAHYNLGNSLRVAGKEQEALAEYETAIKYNPDYARAYNNAGVVLLHLNRLSEAATRFEAALRIDPKYPEAKSNLLLVRSKLNAR